MQDYRRLDVWAKAHELVLETYRATAKVPDRRYPGLVSQLRRAAAAIPATIAEGCGYSTRPEFVRFLQSAGGSVQELHYHLMLAHDLELLPGPEYARLDARTEQVRQMLSGLLRKVRGQSARFPSAPLPGNRFIADGIPAPIHSSTPTTKSGKSARIDSASPAPNAEST